VLKIAGLPEPPKIKPSDTIPFLYSQRFYSLNGLSRKIATRKPSLMERLGNMQRKRLFLVFMISCICLLPIDAGAQATAVGKILKGTAKAAKSHSYGFSRAGIAASEFEKHNRLNRNQDSTSWDSLKKFRPIYMDSSIKWDSLNANRFSNQKHLRDLAPYAESSNEDDFVAEDTGSKNDSGMQTFKPDSSKAKIDTKEKTNKSNIATTYYSDEKDNIAWKLSLGLLILIVVIICCGLKLFSKKGKTK